MTQMKIVPSINFEVILNRYNEILKELKAIKDRPGKNAFADILDVAILTGEANALRTILKSTGEYTFGKEG